MCLLDLGFHPGWRDVAASRLEDHLVLDEPVVSNAVQGTVAKTTRVAALLRTSRDSHARTSLSTRPAIASGATVASKAVVGATSSTSSTASAILSLSRAHMCVLPLAFIGQSLRARVAPRPPAQLGPKLQPSQLAKPKPPVLLRASLSVVNEIQI